MKARGEERWPDFWDGGTLFTRPSSFTKQRQKPLPDWPLILSPSPRVRRRAKKHKEGGEKKRASVSISAFAKEEMKDGWGARRKFVEQAQSSTKGLFHSFYKEAKGKWKKGRRTQKVLGTDLGRNGASDMAREGPEKNLGKGRGPQWDDSAGVMPHKAGRRCYEGTGRERKRDYKKRAY